LTEIINLKSALNDKTRESNGIGIAVIDMERAYIDCKEPFKRMYLDGKVTREVGILCLGHDNGIMAHKIVININK
jgi:hypothetical protein